jgi:hypothetical protein
VALKTVPSLVIDIADADAVDVPPPRVLDSEAGFGFVFTSARSVISALLFSFEIRFSRIGPL